jgi:YXWGXW repeat-containing protein
MMRSKLSVSLTRSFLGLAFAGVLAFSGTGCVVHEVVRAQGEEEVVDREPPPDVAEAPTAAPAGEYDWVKGHYNWNGHDWVWQPGHWQQRKVGYAWVPGHWDRRAHGWVWIEGHWRRQ